MLKPLRLGADLMTIFPHPMRSNFFAPSDRCVDLATLNTQLQKALGTQDWQGSLRIVDRMIAAIPARERTQHSQLEMYRVRIQSRMELRTRANAYFI